MEHNTGLRWSCFLFYSDRWLPKLSSCAWAFEVQCFMLLSFICMLFLSSGCSTLANLLHKNFLSFDVAAAALSFSLSLLYSSPFLWNSKNDVDWNVQSNKGDLSVLKILGIFCLIMCNGCLVRRNVGFRAIRNRVNVESLWWEITQRCSFYGVCVLHNTCMLPVLKSFFFFFMASVWNSF